jgi:DNA-binding SARP family transcriptional activator
LERQRLLLQLDDVWRCGLVTLVAPAGSGKTTLLDQWAGRCGAPVVWLTTESGDAPARTLARRLGSAITKVLGVEHSCENEERLFELLSHPPLAFAVIVDDVHNIRGTDAEALLASLAERLPAQVALLVSARRAPELRLSRRRVDESLVELGIEDLRFRSWETEELFRREYGIPVLPEEAAVLTTRTQGWAAGLQLFHLAIRDKSRSERLQMLDCFGGSYRAVGDYLADNVMAGLPSEIAEFMIASAPLAVLNGDLCDSFLGREGSASLLEELERRELFLMRRGESQVYSYHEILRSYLDGLLTARIGETEARVLHYQAARLLLRTRVARSEDGGAADAGMDDAALRALCRAGSWHEAAELIAARGEQLAGSAAEIIGGIPNSIIDGDPWLQLASARRQLASGNLREAVATYIRCEAGLPQSMAKIARRERLTSANWISPIPSPAPGWSFALRRAVAAEPLSECRELGDDVAGLSCKATAFLLAGHVAKSRELFESASLRVEDPSWDLAIRVGQTAAALLATRDAEERRFVARRCLPLAAEADRLGIAWLNRQAHCLLALVGQTDLAREARCRCRADNDRWGEVIAGLFEGAGRLIAGEAPIELLTETATLARSLGAGVLETVAMAELSLALTVAEYPDAAETALTAEAMARRGGIPGAQVLCHLALSRCTQQPAEHARYASMLAEECGLGIAREIGHGSTRSAEDEAAPVGQGDLTPGVRLRCFGGFEVWREGRRMSEGVLRPRARSLLAILALHHPTPVHVDVLIESLWPEADYEAASHRMQTAISSLRRALQGGREGGVAGPGNRLIRRGAAYVLVDTSTDLDEFQHLKLVADAARAQGNRPQEAEALRTMLALYGGDLLSEFGPAEWLVRERERLRLLAADTAERLAEFELQAGSASTAMAIANRGLSIDCYRESLWRLAERTAERTSDRVAAASLRARRDAVMLELDICID